MWYAGIDYLGSGFDVPAVSEAVNILADVTEDDTCC